MQPKLIITDFTGQKTQVYFKNVKKVYYRQRKKARRLQVQVRNEVHSDLQKPS